MYRPEVKFFALISFYDTSLSGRPFSFETPIYFLAFLFLFIISRNFFDAEYFFLVREHEKDFAK